MNGKGSGRVRLCDQWTKRTDPKSPSSRVVGGRELVSVSQKIDFRSHLQDDPKGRTDGS